MRLYKRLDHVVSLASSLTSVSIEAIRSNSKHARVVEVRIAIAIVARRHTLASYMDIAEATRGRATAHATVQNQVKAKRRTESVEMLVSRIEAELLAANEPER